MLLIPIVALLASCTDQNGTSGLGVPTVGAVAGAPCADFAAGVPQAVTNTQGADTSTVDVTWQLPKPGCAEATRYDIVQIASDGSPDGVVQTVPASTLSATVTGLNVCTYYRFGVEAASNGGFVSAIGLPPHPAYTYGPPTNANIVTIVVQGFDSHVSSASWDPQATPVCTSSRGVYPLDQGQYSPPFPPSLHDLIFAWLNLDDNQRLQHMPAGIGAGNNLIDSLGATGGIVLPFSYTSPGASLDQAKSFTFPGYNAKDVDTSDPTTTQSFNMEKEIQSVHTALPDAKIFVVGHSNGGLVAEQWWWNFGRHNPEGVVQVLSLDSPLNGIFDAAFCNDLVGSCSSTLGNAYEHLWTNQNTLDPQEVTVDNADKLFTAVGTYGDPLYDVADNGATNIPTDARVGIVSQLFYTEPSCNSGFNPLDLNTNRCQPAGRYFIDPCSSKDMPLDHNWGPPVIPPGYGAPGSLWMHSVVKNCPGVITEIMSFYPRVAPPKAPTGQSTSIPGATGTTGTTGTTTCGVMSIFDYVQGDQCTHTGGLLTTDGLQLTVGDLRPGTNDSGKPELCATVKGINTTSDPKFLTALGFNLESAGPGPGVSLDKGGTTVNLQSPIGGTLNRVGILAAGGTGTGTVCFDAGITSSQQVLIIYSPGAQGRSIWVK